jgi:acetyl-CoA carboxylase biotin carboxyl carrier protein
MDLERIESLLKLMKEYGVAELGLEEEDGSVHLNMVGSAPAMVAAPVAAYAPPSSPASVSTSSSNEDSNSVGVESPMVGTFYTAAKPGSPPFVKVGDAVSVGQVLCIVEAMKLMNEIESEVAGTVVEVSVSDAEAVQFGQVLFRIEPA